MNRMRAFKVLLSPKAEACTVSVLRSLAFSEPLGFPLRTLPFRKTLAPCHPLTSAKENAGTWRAEVPFGLLHHCVPRA